MNPGRIGPRDYVAIRVYCHSEYGILNSDGAIRIYPCSIGAFDTDIYDVLSGEHTRVNGLAFAAVGAHYWQAHIGRQEVEDRHEAVLRKDSPHHAGRFWPEAIADGIASKERIGLWKILQGEDHWKIQDLHWGNILLEVRGVSPRRAAEIQSQKEGQKWNSEGFRHASP